MESKFKCCRKDISNYICIVCLGLFHPSCMERRSSIIKLGKCRVYCSEHCQKEDQNREEKEKTWLEELKKARHECEEKSVFIERLKRRSQDFEDEVINVEGKYVREIMDQKNMITDLGRRILELQSRGEEWQRQFEEKDQLVIRLEKDIAELSDLNRSLISTIKILEEENKMHLCELERVGRSVSDFESRDMQCRSYAGDNCGNGNRTFTEGVFKGPDNVKNQAVANLKNISSSNSKSGSNKLLILSDETGRHVSKVLAECLRHRNMRVESIRKPGAWLCGVVSDIGDLAASYTFSDYVLIMAGVNDFINGKYPSFKTLNNKINACANTNVLMASVPYVTSHRINKRIYKFNTKLYEYSLRMNAYSQGRVEFLDINGSENIELGGAVISEKIADIVSRDGTSGNLVFVQTSDDATVKIRAMEAMEGEDQVNLNLGSYSGSVESSERSFLTSIQENPEII